MGKFPDNYDHAARLGEAVVGQWEVVPVWVTDVRRIESMRRATATASASCTPPQAYFANVHEDLYDTNMAAVEGGEYRA